MGGSIMIYLLPRQMEAIHPREQGTARLWDQVIVLPAEEFGSITSLRRVRGS